MAHVGVSVNDDTKEQWDEYVQQTDYGSMSELIRTAVRKEIRREGTDGSGVPRELEQELTRVAETQNTLQDQMSELLDGFDNVEELVGKQQYSQEIIDVATEIAGELDEIHPDEFNHLESDVSIEYAELAKEYFGTPNEGYKIAQAFEYLSENLSYVRSRPLGPSDYYRVRGE